VLYFDTSFISIRAFSRRSFFAKQPARRLRPFSVGCPSRLARRYIGRFETKLRAGVALHLALANNHRAAAIYSLDKALLEAGKILDLPVSLAI
jgi:hypothetical protein